MPAASRSASAATSTARLPTTRCTTSTSTAAASNSTPSTPGQWARPAGHLERQQRDLLQGDGRQRQISGTAAITRVDASGGWYDAGDYGKYVVNGGISVWTLMNMYEFNPAAFADGTLNIPESDNGCPGRARRSALGDEFPAGDAGAGRAAAGGHGVPQAARAPVGRDAGEAAPRRPPATNAS